MYIWSNWNCQFQIKAISLELLSIIHETENEDVTGVMQKFVCIYTQHLVPIASEICTQLARTFNSVNILYYENIFLFSYLNNFITCFIIGC